MLVPAENSYSNKQELLNGTTINTNALLCCNYDRVCKKNNLIFVFVLRPRVPNLVK